MVPHLDGWAEWQAAAHPKKPYLAQLFAPGPKLLPVLEDGALDGRPDTWSGMDLAFRTQMVVQMAMQGHYSGKTVGFDRSKREMIL